MTLQLRRKAKEHLSLKQFEEALRCLDIAVDLHSTSYKVGLPYQRYPRPQRSHDCVFRAQLPLQRLPPYLLAADIRPT